MKQSRELIESIVKENKVWKFEEDCQNSVFAQVVYGITTGFGKFARTVIEKDKLSELQVKTLIVDSNSVSCIFRPT